VENKTTQTRFLVDLPCAFGATPSTPRNGTVTSIGPNGCFVKTKVTVIDEQILFVRLWTAEERWLHLRGRVSYHMEKVGFSLTFGELTEDDVSNLKALIEGLRQQNNVGAPA
jgi:hypothetical protein